RQGVGPKSANSPPGARHGCRSCSCRLMRGWTNSRRCVFRRPKRRPSSGASSSGPQPGPPPGRPRTRCFVSSTSAATSSRSAGFRELGSRPRGLRHEAANRGARPAVITFDAHPEEILLGAAPPVLVDPDERLVRLTQAGVEVTIVQHFDKALRMTPYQGFVEMITSRTHL